MRLQQRIASSSCSSAATIDRWRKKTRRCFVQFPIRAIFQIFCSKMWPQHNRFVLRMSTNTSTHTLIHLSKNGFKRSFIVNCRILKDPSQCWPLFLVYTVYWKYQHIVRACFLCFCPITSFFKKDCVFCFMVVQLLALPKTEALRLLAIKN